MSDDLEGDGWRVLRPRPDQALAPVAIDHLVPGAPWFWHSLERFCVPACCGLDAYDFSEASVSCACGWGTEPPEQGDWRDDHPGDPHRLAAALRDAAHQVRRVNAPAVTAAMFGDVLTPASYADLLETLADRAEPPTGMRPDGP